MCHVELQLIKSCKNVARNTYKVLLTIITYLPDYVYVTSGVCHVCNDVSRCFGLGQLDPAPGLAVSYI